MTVRAVRRFTIADAMILVVATGASSLLLKVDLPGFFELERRLRPLMRYRFTGAHLVQAWLHGPGSCVVVPLMFAVLAAMLVPPRRRWRRVARQPGFAASAAGVASLVPGLCHFAALRGRDGFAQFMSRFHIEWTQVIWWTPYAVIGAWFALLLSSRWRSEADWVDRLGRLLGGYWLLLYAGGWLLELAVWLATWSGSR